MRSNETLALKEGIIRDVNASAPTKYPSDWVLVKLGEICSLRAESRNPANTSDELIYIGLENINSGEMNIKNWGYPKDVRSCKNSFYEGDVLYGKLRPYLDKAAIAHKNGICSTDILVLMPKKDKIISYFLVNILHKKDFLKHAISTTSGVNHPRTSWSALEKFAFAIPPLPEQRAIACALHAVQGAREARLREISLERERKAALMEHLFASDSWNVMPLEKCAFVQTGVTKGRRLEDNSDKIMAPYLRVANVQDGFLDLEEIQFIEIRRSELERYLLQPGDILLTEGGDFDKLGRGFIWHGQIHQCIHQNHIFAVRANKELLLPEFLTYLIQSEYGKAYFLSVAHRTTHLACINSTKLKAFPVLVPELNEQREIAKVLSACDAKIAALDHEACLHDELFRAMLEELMSGRLKVDALEKQR